MLYQINSGDIVLLAKNYIVFKSGLYNLLDHVMCKKMDEDTNYSTCTFLAATVIGIELNEENN